jgi:hypothetical protein
MTEIVKILTHTYLEHYSSFAYRESEYFYCIQGHSERKQDIIAK